MDFWNPLTPKFYSLQTNFSIIQCTLLYYSPDPQTEPEGDNSLVPIYKKDAEVQECEFAEVGICISADLLKCRFAEVQICRSADLPKYRFAEVQVC